MRKIISIISVIWLTSSCGTSGDNDQGKINELKDVNSKIEKEDKQHVDSVIKDEYIDTVKTFRKLTSQFQEINQGDSLSVFIDIKGAIDDKYVTDYLDTTYSDYLDEMKLSSDAEDVYPRYYHSFAKKSLEDSSIILFYGYTVMSPTELFISLFTREGVLKDEIKLPLYDLYYGNYNITFSTDTTLVINYSDDQLKEYYITSDSLIKK